MPSSVAVFGNPPAAAAAPSRNEFYFNRDYAEALELANHNKTNFPETWKTKLHNTEFGTPEAYALDFATQRAIERNQPPAPFQPFVKPDRHGGV